MQNSYSNKLSVFGSKEDIKRFKEKAAGNSPWNKERNVLNFHSLVPVPQKIIEAGDQTGRDWEQENWGCKSGACNSELWDDWEYFLTYSFDTESLPVKFFEKLGPQWPALIFLFDYEEKSTGMRGIYKFQNDSVEGASQSSSDQS